MKKQYIIALLLLIGFGVVSTMAFSIQTGLDISTDVYDLQTNGATDTISKVKVYPYKTTGDLKLKITFSSATTVASDIYLDIAPEDFTGVTCTATAGTASHTDAANGHFEITNIPTTTTSITVTLTDSTYVEDVSLWEDIDSMLITHADV